MNPINKKSPGARGVSQPFERQAGRASQAAPVAQLKTGVSSQSTRRPVAPPVYRPQPAPRVLQTKSSTPPGPPAAQVPRRPNAPPAYRPEVKKIVQPKAALSQSKMTPAAQAHTPPKAPPVFRPRPLITPAGLPAQRPAASAAVPIQAKAVGQGRVLQPSAAPILKPRLPARPGAQAPNIHRAPASAIQRKVFLDDNETSWNDIMAMPYVNHLEDTQQEIIRRWVDQQTEHYFNSNSRGSAAANLFTAAAAAAGLLAKGDAINDLFRAENLKFMTQAPDRKPTLYFVSGKDSGRLRQTHGGGPKIGMEEYKTDFFYKNLDDLRAFHNKMRNLRINQQAPGYFEWKWEQTWHGLPSAKEGDYHLEVTRDQAGVVTNTHQSGGTYSSNVGKYTDNWLGENIWGVVGLAAVNNL